MNSTGVWFGCSSTPQPIFGKLVQNRTKPKFLKLHASLVNFPLASKIMVRNLSYSTTESCLRDEFSTYGQVAEVKLVVDEDSKRSKGYAFIQYTSQDDAILALESMDHKLSIEVVQHIHFPLHFPVFRRQAGLCGISEART
ncbi:multiple RNA-binding domain-containing protein 1-like isoform X3 [Rhododendron vialii]|uniref:multiple RNA-binding domain-containing protein 1-like isoform X3 n=1 Tax=Rhododendron vialii TaxID=182163 RepID=UPI00265E11D2|nr:multiple RNA-binding domain-containing protein 1-like isoform X3 [Rhododendron vialii]